MRSYMNHFPQVCFDERAETVDTGIYFFRLINMAVRNKTRAMIALGLPTFLPAAFLPDFMLSNHKEIFLQ